MDSSLSRSWILPFLDSARIEQGKQAKPLDGNWALIVLNQPTSRDLLDVIWHACSLHVFADGGSNRVYDVVGDSWKDYLPDLIVGDLDSIRPEVHQAYLTQGVKVIQDENKYETDLMKAVQAIQDFRGKISDEYSIIILGGLSGRLDQTVHTMSYLHKLRKSQKQIFVISDDNVGWVLDSGQHNITLDRTFLGPTCGLLPVGINKTILSMKGLEWNWNDHESSFDGDISTSNWLASDYVWIKTAEPIWWTIELRLSTNK